MHNSSSTDANSTTSLDYTLRSVFFTFFYPRQILPSYSGCYRGQYKNGVRSGYGTRMSAAYELGNKETTKSVQDSSKHRSLSILVGPLAHMKKLATTSTSSMPLPEHAIASDNSASPESFNKQIYEGEWKNDKRHGYGAIKCTGSYTYYGQWVDNTRTGYGVLVYENGTKEEGQWQSGQLIVALKRKKIHLKSHQLEVRVQSAHTLAIQAADAARNKATLAGSRAVSAMAKHKMAQVVAAKAVKDALLAREKAELYKNAHKISGECPSVVA